MDPKLGKSGKVYLQPRKSGRKWKPVWLALVPPSSSGVGRLEIQPLGGTIGEHALRRPQALGEKRHKVIRLSELLNVLRLPPNAEACPMENMCAFCVETQERTLVFAALKDDCTDWVEKLCQNTFQKSNVPELKPQMEENVIYASADEVSDFPVTLQRTDAAVRCGLQGAYWLKVDREALLLRDAQKNKVMVWPYELLRRYGKDKGVLTIETGRRCECGPGTFIFESPQPENIFSLILSHIKHKSTHTPPSGANSLEREKPTTLNRLSALPRTPAEFSSMSAIFDAKLKMDNEEPASSHPAPITLMPLPSLPTQETRSKHATDNVYADPNVCLHSPEASMGMYVDPASILPLKPPAANSEASQNKLHSDYAEVFDKVSVKRSERKFKDDDHIYSEPMRGEKEETEEETEEEKKEDQFAHLYAQVCKANKNRSTSPQPKAEEVKEEDQFAHLYAQVCKTNKNRSASPQPKAEEVKEEEKADQFAHLYAQVCKTNKNRSASPQPKAEEKEREVKVEDDVIYENLGII
ncbi:hypothetical protein WMY93_006172 [Mugilogobius chulae]|uniref:IRS-type PTB domain-containing protein n=1 Tax=Mugilogobius chulae TaxID=88201 RepID=A0AAW0PSS8_9GOBI